MATRLLCICIVCNNQHVVWRVGVYVSKRASAVNIKVKLPDFTDPGKSSFACYMCLPYVCLMFELAVPVLRLLLDYMLGTCGESKAQRVEVKTDVKGGVKGGHDGDIKHEQGTHREEYAPTVTGDNGDDDDVVFLHEHKARKRPRVVIDLEDEEVTPIKGQTKPLKTEST